MKIHFWLKNLHDIQLFDQFRDLMLMHSFEVNTLNCIKYTTNSIWYFFLLLLKYYGTFSYYLGKCTNRKKYHTPLGTFSYWYFFLVFVFFCQFKRSILMHQIQHTKNLSSFQHTIFGKIIKKTAKIWNLRGSQY